MLRLALRAVLALLIGVALLLAAAYGYRAYRQDANGRAFAIATPDGIDEASFVAIGGIQQWMTVRGRDRANPVILILHGGPGSATSQLGEVFHGWEKDFTVVQWDQRGAGKTFGRNGAHEGAMTLDRLTKDGIEVAQYLLVHLHKKKVFLLGHSWGSELGLAMIKSEPGLFFAYVGTGQVVAKEEKEEILYDRLMAKLKAAHDEDGIARLTALGRPPYKSEADLDVERDVQRRFETETERKLFRTMTPVALFAPGYTLRDISDYLKGKEFAGEAMYRELLGFDARKLGPHFDVPVFVFDGEHDLTTPPDLARAWLAGIDAPQKGFVIFRGGGHNAVLTMPDVFLAELKAHVRPIALRN